MRMVPQGPTGLGHLAQTGRGSIKDLSQLPEYKPEPGFEEFDYNPHEEGAGETQHRARQHRLITGCCCCTITSVN